MDQKKMLKQMIDLNKATYRNSFNTIVTLQEQMEKATNALLAEAAWLPEEGRKAVKDWVASYKKGQETYKTNIDESFKKVEQYFSTEG